MPLYDDIQKAIDMGNGAAASVLGTPHNVYRVSNTSNGHIIHSSNLVASNVKAFVKIIDGSSRASLETEKAAGILWYRVLADLRQFRVGDIWINNDPIYGQGMSTVNFNTDEFKGFALADRSPIKRPIAGRINCTVRLYRPADAVQESHWDRTLRDSRPVILANGIFSLGAKNATASQIPAGLIALRSFGDRAFENIPAEQRKSSWRLYLPSLPGFRAREGDRVIGPDGARYIVLIPFRQDVGATGDQWLLEREAG